MKLDTIQIASNSIISRGKILVCNSNVLYLNDLLYFPLVKLTMQSERFVDCTVEFPQIYSVCLGCVINLITAPTVFPMKLEYSVSGYVFRHGVTGDVM